MKKGMLVMVAVLVGLVVGLVWGLAAPAVERVSADSEPLTVRVNLRSEDPVTLDPAKAWSQASFNVIEQLFVGLVDLDDDTGEVHPELATDWTVSPDSTVYTFTLRSDVTWTGGMTVTAQDAAYGILRALDPATASDWVYVLYPIENAEAYNVGTITDTAEVGVTALDSTHLQVTLERPASQILSILAHPVARPVPQQVVETWGDNWTDVEHIVTSGAYCLTEWVRDDHLELDKNPDYYDADDVQIERVMAYRVDEATAWQMYLDGDLDTALVPGGRVAGPVRGSRGAHPVQRGHVLLWVQRIAGTIPQLAGPQSVLCRR